ncbi:MAG: endonuclease NucS domain-containing protein [Bacteroidota bacterium]
MKNYYRIMLGRGSSYADECYKNNFIGAYFNIDVDLTNQLPDKWKDFNHKFIPVWMQLHPDKTKVSAGLSCGALWTVAKGINIGDIVLCPNGQGSYYVGEVLDTYSYHPEGILPHRRTVKWSERTIERTVMSEAMQNSVCSMGTVSNITRYAEEIETLISDSRPPTLISTIPDVENPTVFALEKHLEDFLIHNWKHTELGKNYDVFEEDGGLVGRQFQCDTGAIDILAISKDKKTLLVVELKKGRVSDVVVGQIQRYMSFVKEELAEENQNVKGVIIGLEEDIRIKRALAVANNIEFYRYEVSFKLFKS